VPVQPGPLLAALPPLHAASACPCILPLTLTLPTHLAPLTPLPMPLPSAQFGPGPMQQHGFARNLDWTVASTSANPNPDDPEPTVGGVVPGGGWNGG